MQTSTEEEVDPRELLRRKVAARKAAQQKQPTGPRESTEQVGQQETQQQQPVAGQQPVAAVKSEEAPAQSPAASKPIIPQVAGRQVLYFDLETVPDERRIDLFELDPLPEVVHPIAETPMDRCPKIEDVVGKVADVEDVFDRCSPCEEWLDALVQFEKANKKREGVLKAVEKCRAAKQCHVTSQAARVAAEEARIKKMSVTPEMCKIAALGFAIGELEPVSLVVGIDGVTEEGILEVFWGLARQHAPVIGFNCLGFDLPVIFVRSAMLGVSPTKRFDLKPWSTDVIDLMVARYPRSGATRMKELCRMLEIEIPAGDTDGGAVYQLMRTEPAKVAEYVRSDIVVTRKLHHTFKGFFCS